MGVDEGQRVAGQLVRTPGGAIGQDADVSLAALHAARPNVAAELPLGLQQRAPVLESSLDLDDGVADFDVDASAAAGRGFEVDVVEVVVGESEVTGQQKLADVGLQGCFAAGGAPIGDPRQEGLQ
ncbi:hypothetical protein [Micromonospora sp. NPDC023814]|uniref:hypothetical protein n=1 Tax=Micromonospora sp. NPDC023814 TaxID=3154596 RepID=UPI00340D4540